MHLDLFLVFWLYRDSKHIVELGGINNIMFRIDIYIYI